MSPFWSDKTKVMSDIILKYCLICEPAKLSNALLTQNIGVCTRKQTKKLCRHFVQPLLEFHRTLANCGRPMSKVRLLFSALNPPYCGTHIYCAWTCVMKIRPRGGPWTRSMRVVHGPGPRSTGWSMDRVHGGGPWTWVHVLYTSPSAPSHCCKRHCTASPAVEDTFTGTDLNFPLVSQLTDCDLCND